MSPSSSRATRVVPMPFSLRSLAAISRMSRLARRMACLRSCVAAVSFDDRAPPRGPLPDGDGAGPLAGAVAAHAVGDRGHRLGAEVAVLVVLAHPTHVGGGGEYQARQRRSSRGALPS